MTDEPTKPETYDAYVRNERHAQAEGMWAGGPTENLSGPELTSRILYEYILVFVLCMFSTYTYVFSVVHSPTLPLLVAIAILKS